jgi:NAD-dependent deacetylase
MGPLEACGCDRARFLQCRKQPEVAVIDVEALMHVTGLLKAAEQVAVLTGAGISAESGVPTFRGVDGLWRSYSATDLATPEAFARDPLLVWQWYRWRQGIVARAEPNPGHTALARLQARLAGFTLITQNVDGLHQRAGNSGVIELHGNIWRARCARGCGVVLDLPVEAAKAGRHDESGDVPACPCGALLRPDIVWFGEALGERQISSAVRAARQADVFLAVGTSAIVYPAAGLPALAGRAGALVVEVNIEETPLSPLAAIVLRGKAAEVLPGLEARL